MHRRKRFMIFGLSMLVAFGMLYLERNVILGFLADKAIQRIKPKLAPHGVHIERVSFKRAEMRSLRSYAITDLAMDFYMEPSEIGLTASSSTFQAREIHVSIHTFWKPAITFSFEDFTLTLVDGGQSLKTPFARFENAYWRREAPVPLLGSGRAARNILSAVRRLFRENRVAEPLHFEGDVLLSLDDREAKARLYTVRENGFTSLRFVPEDLRDAAEGFGIRLGQAEVELVSTYPLRAPAVLKMTHVAKKTSREAANADRTVPEDAYRHVLWSYLLTEAFGPDFAKAITDAHETVPGNTPEERQMDFHNNAIGRQYALDGVPRRELLSRVRTDPAVIRDPGEVALHYR